MLWAAWVMALIGSVFGIGWALGGIAPGWELMTKHDHDFVERLGVLSLVMFSAAMVIAVSTL